MLVVFGAFYLLRQNYEFIIYVGVLILLLAVVLGTNRKVCYPNGVLWGLLLWGFLHMAGGAVPIGDGRLYDTILIPISEKYQIFRYDQFIHIVGFGTATYLMYSVLCLVMKPDVTGRWAVSIIVVMAGLGIGAVNEIVEFGIVLATPESGVGGYTNTMLDLVADLIGSLVAIAIILHQRRPKNIEEC